jgi:hypothetical protein
MAGVKAFFLLQNAEGLIQLADPMRYCESVRSEASLARTFPSLPEEIDGGNDLRQTLATIAPACLPVLEQRFQSGSVSCCRLSSAVAAQLVRTCSRSSACR